MTFRRGYDYPWIDYMQWPTIDFVRWCVPSLEDRRYFAFIEDVVPPAVGAVHFGPGGDRLHWMAHGQWPSFEDDLPPKLVTIRLSGLSKTDFYEAAQGITPMRSDTPTAEDRARRREELERQLGKTDLPMFHVLISVLSDAWPMLRAVFSTGDWCELTIRHDGPDWPAPIVLSSPERGGETSRIGSLSAIDVVRRRDLRRLRDIFSLAHLADADFGEGSEGTPIPPPVTPPPLGRFRREENDPPAAMYREAGA